MSDSLNQAIDLFETWNKGHINRFLIDYEHEDVTDQFLLSRNIMFWGFLVNNQPTFNKIDGLIFSYKQTVNRSNNYQRMNEVKLTSEQRLQLKSFFDKLISIYLAGFSEINRITNSIFSKFNGTRADTFTALSIIADLNQSDHSRAFSELYYSIDNHLKDLQQNYDKLVYNMDVHRIVKGTHESIETIIDIYGDFMGLENEERRKIALSFDISRITNVLRERVKAD